MHQGGTPDKIKLEASTWELIDAQLTEGGKQIRGSGTNFSTE